MGLLDTDMQRLSKLISKKNLKMDKRWRGLPLGAVDVLCEGGSRGVVVVVPILLRRRSDLVGAVGGIEFSFVRDFFLAANWTRSCTSESGRGQDSLSLLRGCTICYALLRVFTNCFIHVLYKNLGCDFWIGFICRSGRVDYDNWMKGDRAIWLCVGILNRKFGGGGVSQSQVFDCVGKKICFRLLVLSRWGGVLSVCNMVLHLVDRLEKLVYYGESD